MWSFKRALIEADGCHWRCVVANIMIWFLVSTAVQRLHLSEFEFLFQVCEYFHVARHLFKHWTKIVKSQNKKTTEDYVGLSLSPFTFSLATWLKHSFLQCSNQAPPCWANSSSSEVNSLKINPRVVAPPMCESCLLVCLLLVCTSAWLHVVVVQPGGREDEHPRLAACCCCATWW